ncbi:hypothetical protein HK102_005462 [Quaeritorhiza haematococci]|nr:hypothetical protein HK102_005462 [Quaeritorhiza haematococci]
MINYQYVLPEVEYNNRAYLHDGTIAVTESVPRPSPPHDQSPPAPSNSGNVRFVPGIHPGLQSTVEVLERLEQADSNGSDRESEISKENDMRKGEKGEKGGDEKEDARQLQLLLQEAFKEIEESINADINCVAKWVATRFDIDKESTGPDELASNNLATVEEPAASLHNADISSSI